jgi:hypothetical protein
MPLSCKCCLLLLAPLAAAFVAWAPPGDLGAQARAAQAFLDALPEELRAKAQFAFDDAERTRWHFVPQRYPGVELGALSLEQRRLAHDLVRSALSQQGYLKATAILSLEDILRDMAEARGQRAEHRDPERYALAFFGKPDARAPWGWRLQGHHLSLNFAFADGKPAVTPLFLGANPAEVREGRRAGLRVLGAHEDRARALLEALDDAQRARAIVQREVPADIVAAPGRDPDVGEPIGLAFGDMTAPQRALLRALLQAWAEDLHADLAQSQLARIEAAGFDAIRFAWIGATEPGQPHYFRLHGPTFVIEYDNVQDGANHVHTVWRDRERDFAK